MLFNDRRQAKTNARALKKAQGPSLATPAKKLEATKNMRERYNVKAEADYFTEGPSRKARYAKAVERYSAHHERKGM